MILKIRLELMDNLLPIDIYKCVVSYIKHAIENYDNEMYEEFYGAGKNTIKGYTFSLHFPKAEFNKDAIRLNEKWFEIYLSAADMILMSHLRNAFMSISKEYYHFGKTKGICVQIKTSWHKVIRKNNILIKFESPLVLKSRESDKDTYYTAKDELFSEMFHKLVNYELSLFGIDEDHTLEIEPIAPKTVCKKSFGLNIPGSIGVYKLTGKPETLNFLYQSGAGSRRSEGSGKFQVIAEV